MFSDLVEHFDQPSNALQKAKEARISQGLPILDLVSGNPHVHGIHFPQDILNEATAKALELATDYRPHPLGQPVARAAISRFYADQDLSVSSDYIVLAPGTSLSYLYLLRILANVGDEVLVPHPGYPLFEPIAATAGVTLVPYPLRYSDTWHYDLEAMERAITPRSKAIVVVSPHNPTGCIADRKTLDAIAQLAQKHNLAIISDEVFSPFLYAEAALPRAAQTKAPLVFTLNGFSKMFALPGLKIGWIVTTGDTVLVKKALRALEMLSDAYLPVNEIAQFMVPDILEKGKPFTNSFVQTLKQRRNEALRLLSDIPHVKVLPPAGGFYMPVELDTHRDEEVAIRLLQDHGILMHPGYFYDLPTGYLVSSFVAEADAWSDAAQAIKNITGR